MEKILSNGVWYPANTNREVIAAIESAQRRRVRIHISYGLDDGTDSIEENGVFGYVGRSAGPQPAPLLVHNRRSLGGGTISANAIVRIRETATGKVLWQHPGYDYSNKNLTSRGGNIYRGPRHVQARLKDAVAVQRWAQRFGVKVVAPPWDHFESLPNPFLIAHEIVEKLSPAIVRSYTSTIYSFCQQVEERFIEQFGGFSKSGRRDGWAQAIIDNNYSEETIRTVITGWAKDWIEKFLKDLELLNELEKANEIPSI